MGTDMTKSAIPARSVISPDQVPYATPEEMFIIKICACPRRSDLAKQRQDVADAEFLAEHLHRFDLVGDPIDRSLECFEKFLPFSSYPKTWWEARISMFQPGRCSMEDWFDFQSGGYIGELVVGRPR